ncbi:MAG: HAD-IA family hydrolase [Proteobacteria bacterium]|nr:HAD-IA family hydrolase [Pseudomonadota bacterium]MDA0992859.1 HAD-IA family hydrolase [Pseudomonadota bacterium]
MTIDPSAVKIRTLIFDLDGTISDPFEGISKSVNYALGELGYETVDPEQVRPMIGPPLTEIFAFLIGDVPEGHMQLLVDKYRERYASIGYRENLIYDGIPETIAALSTAGYRLGICTSKRADYATSIVKMFGLSTHFRFISGGDVGVHKSEQLEELVANGVDARTAAMIGDRHIDIEAAKSNGIMSVGVDWGFGADEELNLAAPDYRVRSPRELLDLFE